jgi:hypothetical protein
MALPRTVQAMFPLLLTPLVALWLDLAGGDKAPVFAIPWMAFGVAYWIAFEQLAKVIKGTLVLTVASATAALAGGAILTMLAVALLKGSAGY